jgi:hypothetical protein
MNPEPHANGKHRPGTGTGNEQLQPQCGCPSRDDLFNAAFDVAPPGVADTVRAHAVVCSACRTLFRGYLSYSRPAATDPDTNQTPPPGSATEPDRPPPPSGGPVAGFVVEPAASGLQRRRSAGRRSAALATAALLVAALVFAAVMFLRPPTASIFPGVAPEVAARPVVEWGFSTTPSDPHRNIDPQVVYTGQGYQFQPRITTHRAHGWLYQIDGRSAFMLRKLDKQPDGTLTGDYDDTFDAVEGIEYFLIILADEDVPALNAGDEPAAWLTPSERARLQRLGEQDAGTDETLRVFFEALRRHGWKGTPDDLCLQRLKHKRR